MKPATKIIVVIVALLMLFARFVLSASTMSVLSDEEIRELRNKNGSASSEDKYAPGQKDYPYTKWLDLEEKKTVAEAKPEKTQVAMAEKPKVRPRTETPFFGNPNPASFLNGLARSLTNTVSRSAAAEVKRVRGDVKDKSYDIDIKMGKGKVYIIYQARISNGAKVKEFCSITFPGMPEWRTSRGYWEGPEVTEDEMKKALKFLEESQIYLREISVSAASEKELEEDGKILLSLGLHQMSLIGKPGDGRRIVRTEIVFPQINEKELAEK
jgi:hypothetical protein